MNAPLITGNINALSDRAAMGLPDHYVAPRCEGLDDALSALRGASNPVLLRTATDPAQPLASRFAAGTLLGVWGDPRITPFDPPMVEVTGGTARIGTDPNRVDDLHARYERFGVRRNWIEKECPRFDVTVRSFKIGKYPVTNSEYEVFLADSRFEELPSSWAFGRISQGAGNHPVYTVSPRAADAYAAWLSQRTGRRFRLPTEYEWEYAAAGPDGKDFPWGDEAEPECANTMEIALMSTTPIGIFPRGAAPCGALDMAGNVEEYVATEYHAYPGWSLVEDDLFLLLGHYRVAKGGAFNRFFDLARCQRRHGPYPKSLYAIGFRLAEDV